MQQVYAKAIKFGGFSDLFSGFVLVEHYAKCGKMVLVERVLCMPKQNAMSWNSENEEMESMKGR